MRKYNHNNYSVNDKFDNLQKSDIGDFLSESVNFFSRKIASIHKAERLTHNQILTVNLVLTIIISRKNY